MLIEENKELAPLTTLGIGGPARWYVSAGTEADIADAAAWARGESVPLFVLGGGSNLVVADAGFDGLVLHIALKGIHAQAGVAGFNERVYRVAAGEDWDQFVQRTVEEDCAGLECLAGIPGTTGGTPVQNVGAYGQEVSRVIDRVRAFDLHEQTFVEFTATDCAFAYRHSRFNTTDRGRYAVSRVDYRLNLHGNAMLKYADLQKEFATNTTPGLREVAETVRSIRRSKGMLIVEGDPDSRSAGSFFKNPIVNAEGAAAVAAVVGEEPPRFPAGPGRESAVKLPAAWLIEKAGFTKGYTLGAAGISSKHTLALVNRGGATAAAILSLADKIRDAVERQFGIQLQMEPMMLGFDKS
ncbi:MAG TPA: UDP-N-acetylmuramate dehydrogenase [Terracidiphilus sp.]|nr:UDP-N-acetylmuramate dehydrogenase [Terracidiphilus sp.]